MRFDPTHFEPLSATPARARLAPLPTLPPKPRLPWKLDPFHRSATLKAARGVDRAEVAQDAVCATPRRKLDSRPAPRHDAVALKDATMARVAATPRSAKLGRAELRTLLAIDLEGGQVCVRTEGARLRYERLDAFGDVQERYAGATVRSLIASGHLRFRRCAFGGNVYSVDGDPVGRAGYRRRPARG